VDETVEDHVSFTQLGLHPDGAGTVTGVVGMRPSGMRSSSPVAAVRHRGLNRSTG
jgi:hypothetical protein